MTSRPSSPLSSTLPHTLAIDRRPSGAVVQTKSLRVPWNGDKKAIEAVNSLFKKFVVLHNGAHGQSQPLLYRFRPKTLYEERGDCIGPNSSVLMASLALPIWRLLRRGSLAEVEWEEKSSYWGSWDMVWDMVWDIGGKNKIIARTEYRRSCSKSESRFPWWFQPLWSETWSVDGDSSFDSLLATGEHTRMMATQSTETRKRDFSQLWSHIWPALSSGYGLYSTCSLYAILYSILR